MNSDIPDIKELLTSREKFSNFVYTPLGEAIKQLDLRNQDNELKEKLPGLFGHSIPGLFLDGKPKGVLFRHLVTPNYETRRFLNLIDGLHQLDPMMLEVRGDKFTSNNKIKYFLGRMGFYNGVNKLGQAIISRKTIVDFSAFDGKRIDQVETIWGQSLVDFHHELLKDFKDIKNIILNLSDQDKLLDKTARSYYEYALPLFMCHAVLFENFLLEDEEELFFADNIFLPVFIKIYEVTGFKPLIVPLEPTDIEGEDFWMCHPPETKTFVDSKEDVL